MPLDSYSAAHLARNSRVFGEKQQIAPQVSVQAQIIGKGRQAAANRAYGIEVYALIEGHYVLGHFSTNRQRIRESADISVNLACDLEKLREAEHVASHVPANHNRLAIKEFVLADHHGLRFTRLRIPYFVCNLFFDLGLHLFLDQLV